MDLVVTVPKWFWSEWIAEGDAVGEPETGEEWGLWTVSGSIVTAPWATVRHAPWLG